MFQYGSLALFAALQAGDNLSYLLINLLAAKSYLSPRLVDFSYSCVYWSTYLLQTVLVFFLIAALIRSSLRPLPGLLAAANTIFRWASILAFALAMTAHLPTLRMMSWHQNLTGLCLSFQFCVCTFEITFISLLLKYMRRLGLFVRSREVGFALGLAAFGVSAYLAGFVNLVAPNKINTVNMLTESVEILTAVVWLYYILMPEPKRQPHSLSPASSLMKWNEIALKLGMGGRQAEQLPFISGVESKVDAVLDRFKIRAE